MVTENDDASPESRPPTINDLVNLCRHLNEAGAKYIVIGGMAMIQAGYTRTTEDIDLLVDISQINQEHIRTAMLHLSDKAIKDVQPDDLDAYNVIRVADEITIDLMKSACGIDYHHAKNFIVRKTIDDVEIPFASPELLVQLKQTGREKDKIDLLFLTELLKN